MNIKKIGLTALAGSLVATSAMAGSLSLSGGAKISYVSKDGTITENTSSANVASGFSMDQEISASGSGELDNGFTVSIAHGMKGMNGDGSDTSSITLGMGDLGTLSYNDTDGHPGLAGLEDFMPMAYEQANDGLGTTATKAVMAKMASGQGFGYSTSLSGASVSIGFSDGLGASTDRTDGGQDTTAASTGASTSIGISYDVMDSLTVKAGIGEEGQGDGKQIDHSTVGFTYSFGPAKVGYQVNDEDDSAAGGTDLETEIYAISFMVNDNFSISYGEHNTDKANNAVDQEAESIQASYSMGGMSINLKESEMSGVGNTAAKDHETTEVLVTFAF
jgi:outer membrane protein OmpU